MQIWKEINSVSLSTIDHVIQSDIIVNKCTKSTTQKRVKGQWFQTHSVQYYATLKLQYIEFNIMLHTTLKLQYIVMSVNQECLHSAAYSRSVFL